MLSWSYAIPAGLERPAGRARPAAPEAPAESEAPSKPAGPDAPDAAEGPAPLLGELALSLERAAAQAAENGWDLRTEVLRLLAHGCAHVAGFDHETAAQERVMQALEVRLLAGVGLRDLYPPDAKG